MNSRSSRQNVLQNALRARQFATKEQSTRLAPVLELFSSQKVHPWRLNGSSPEHAFHRMMSRVGGFPPALARYFIAAYSQPGETVLDPYCGKGTTVFEAIQMGRNAIGGDIAPDAVIASRAKCEVVSVAGVAKYIQDLNADSCRSVLDAPADVRVFFSRSTLLQILSVRKCLLNDMQNETTRDVATFVCGVLLGILHGHSRVSLSLDCNHSFAMSPNYVRRYVREHALARPRRNVKACLLERSLALLPRPEAHGIATIVERPADESPQYLGTMRGKVALVLTSPPYLNRQTYIKDAWLRLWFLNRDRKDVAKHSQETGSVVRFAEAMRRSLTAIVDCVADGGAIVLVCGEAKIAHGARTKQVRVSDLCLHGLDQDPLLRERMEVVSLIRDRRLMNRGSYFAVYAGRNDDEKRKPPPRYGNEEILVLRKRATTARGNGKK